MAIHPIEYAKKHPYVIGGGVVAAVALVLFLHHGQPDQTLVGAQAIPLGGGSAGASDGADQVQAMLAQVNGSIQLAQIAAQSKADELAAQNYQADLAAHTADNANQLAANLGLSQITAQIQALTITAGRDVDLATVNADLQKHGIDVQGDVAKYIQNLAAQTSQQANTLASQVAINAQNQATAQLGIQSNALIQQTKLTADALVKQTQAQANVGMAQATKKCTSVLFGLFSSC